MTTRVKHQFTSLKADGPDSTFVKPSDWNAEHTLVSDAAGFVLGRDTSGAGNIQELPIEVSPTGDVKFPDSHGATGIASGTTAQRPVAPDVGSIRYNSTLSRLEIFSGGVWVPVGFPVGMSQVRLQFMSSTVLRLMPYNGTMVTVAGQAISVPLAGIAVGNTGIIIDGNPGLNLAVDTTYYVAFDAAGILEFWTQPVGHVPDNTPGNLGVEVINGHATKSLVGMIRTNNIGEFADADGSRFVLSWFNRGTKRSRSTFTADVTVAATGAMAELNSSIRNNFLTWGGGNPIFTSSGTVLAAAGTAVATGVSFNLDPAELEGALGSGGVAASAVFATSFSGMKTGLAEGYHFATLFGNWVASGAGGATWYGGTKPPDATGATQGPSCSLTVVVNG